MRKGSLIVAMIAVMASGAIAEDELITIGSGNTVGMYYSTSSAIAKLFNYKRQEYQQWVDTEASEGSEENIEDVLSGKVQFGFAQANILEKAIKGIGPWEGQPQTGLVAVLTLYTEEFTVVAADDAGITSLADLKGKRVNIGAPGSSTQESARRFIGNIGLKLDEVTLFEEPASRSQDLLANDEIDAYLFTVGHPAFSIREASSGKRKVRLIPLDQALIDEVVTAVPTVRASIIPTTYYPGLTNTEPIHTVGTPAVLFTHEGMSDETVYRMVKEVMTNFDLFCRQQPVLADLTAKGIAEEVVIPLHPGAKRYFEEAGLLP